MEVGTVVRDGGRLFSIRRKGVSNYDLLLSTFLSRQVGIRWAVRIVSSSLIGQTLGHYRVTDQLGAGGMGVVYRAQDTKLGRQVAIKVLPAGSASTTEALERFRREARTASSLTIPNICTVYGFDERAGQCYLAMELLEGEPLDQRLNGRPLEFRTLLDIAVQVADALDAAHGDGILHRDIKPANIFITRRGQVKVLDFGLAKLTSDAQRLSGTDAILETRARALLEHGRHHRRHHRLHVARAGARRGSGPADRPVFVRRRALRDGDRPPELPGPHDRGRLRRHPQSRPRAAERDQPRAAERPGSDHRQGARKGTRPALPDRCRPEGGSAAPAARLGHASRVGRGWRRRTLRGCQSRHRAAGGDGGPSDALSTRLRESPEPAGRSACASSRWVPDAGGCGHARVDDREEHAVGLDRHWRGRHRGPGRGTVGDESIGPGGHPSGQHEPGRIAGDAAGAGSSTIDARTRDRAGSPTPGGELRQPRSR